MREILDGAPIEPLLGVLSEVFERMRRVGWTVNFVTEVEGQKVYTWPCMGANTSVRRRSNVRVICGAPTRMERFIFHTWWLVRRWCVPVATLFCPWMPNRCVMKVGKKSRIAKLLRVSVW